MKQPEDRKTRELPGLGRRGRPPAGERAMTPAERQKAYRQRKAQERFAPSLDEMSRVTLMETLSNALACLERKDYEFREGAEAVAEQVIRELVTRYELRGDKVKPSRVTK